MAEVNEHAPGSFCWFELGTTDPDGARKFYTELFGWGANDTPAGPFVYTMLQLRGKDVAAMYGLSEEQKSQGIPSHWLSYVSVADVNASTEKAKSLGGTAVLEPFDVMEHGRMSLIQDPTGAMIALWQPGDHFGRRIVNEPGALCWNELHTADVGKAADFYTNLFGWKARASEGPIPYTEWINGETPIGGMMQITPEMGDIPPHWMGYIAVNDCDATVETAKRLGGNILVPSTDIPDVGRFAVIQDPQGAALAVIRLSIAG